MGTRSVMITSLVAVKVEQGNFFPDPGTLRPTLRTPHEMTSPNAGHYAAVSRVLINQGGRAQARNPSVCRVHRSQRTEKLL